MTRLSPRSPLVKQRVRIADLQPSQLIDGVFAIHNCQLGQTKNGKPYIKCLLSDHSGRTPGRLWSAPEGLFRGLPTDGFVYIEGQAQPYQGEMQIILQHIQAAEPSEDDLLWLLPASKYDVAEMFAEVKAILQSLKHPALSCLAAEYLKDDALMGRFQKAPAAVTLHHAYLGGLLEHTLATLKVGAMLCPLYPELSRDLLLVGLFLHDLGKCQELSWERGFAYSDEGQLVGHTALGLITLDRKTQTCAAAGLPLPAEMISVLQHILLSHHGKPEFGALKIPATPEAIAVSLIDNLDAKLHMVIAATRGELPGGEELAGNFTQKVWALETRLYRPDVTAP